MQNTNREEKSMRDYDFGNHLMMLRKSCGYSQFQLGTLVGVSDKAVSKWETGRSMPDASIMLELCEILGISVNELLSGEVLELNNYNEKVEKNLLVGIRRVLLYYLNYIFNS